MSWTDIVLAAAQSLAVIAAAPLVNGVARATKASLQRRHGPGLLQHYRDLAKLFRKDAVFSRDASWISRVGPFVVFGATAASTWLVPSMLKTAPLGFAGDLFAVLYLLALARFFLALQGLDAGSAFGGEGSSREMALASIFEPPLALVLIVLALGTGSTQIAGISAIMEQGQGHALSAAQPFLLCAFFMLVVAETGRVPVDNPDTHLELTMVHEGMLLEASGPYLALLSWASMIKQAVLLSLAVDLFFPWAGGPPALVAAGWLVKVVFLAIVLGFAETLTAKMRLFKLLDYSTISMGLAFLGLFFLVVGA